MFLPSQYLAKNIAPTWNDTSYQKHVIQVRLQFDTCQHINRTKRVLLVTETHMLWVVLLVSVLCYLKMHYLIQLGHAGLFSNLPDTATLAHQLLFASPQDSYVNKTTIDLFIK